MSIIAYERNELECANYLFFITQFNHEMLLFADETSKMTEHHREDMGIF